MCLYVDKTATKRMLRKDAEWITAYKILAPDDNGLIVTPYMGVFVHPEKGQIFRAKGRCEYGSRSIFGGAIHSALRKPPLKNWHFDGLLAWEVSIHRSWFLAVGTNYDIASTAIRWERTVAFY